MHSWTSLGLGSLRALRDGGHEVVRLRKLLPVESPDRVVIAKAQEIDAVLLSTSESKKTQLDKLSLLKLRTDLTGFI